MGKTYKDREARGWPRVPEWARPKPTKIHNKGKAKKDDPDDLRDQYLANLMEGVEDD